MARPIKPTPVLRGKEADRFLKTIAEDMNKPLQTPPPPCLKAAKKAVFANATCQK